MLQRPSSDAYFELTEGGFVPDERARGPWAEDMLHGRLLGGLAARELELAYAEPGWRIARLTVDLFRPAAMRPVQIALVPIRIGRRVRVVDAVLSCDGHQVGRVTAVVLATSQEPPGAIWRPAESDWPDPESLPVPTDGTAKGEDTGWLFRTVEGGFATGERSRVWTNDTVALVRGEATTPLVRAAVSGDFACPLANGSDQGLHYINADYTMLLARYPVGDWIGLEVTQQMQADGISIGSATLVDRMGSFATSGGTSLARAPLD